MMYVGSLLYAEGPSDHLFLQPLLRRVLLDSLERHAHPGTKEVGDVLQAPRAPHDGADRAERIARACDWAKHGIHLVFVHADGAGDPADAIESRVLPGVRLAQARAASALGAVPVVPVRETEAWVISDLDAMAHATNSGVCDRIRVEIGGRSVESVLDPKAVLASGLRCFRGRRRSSADVAGIFPILGRTISLDALRRLNSFQATETALREALQEVGLAPS